MSLRKERQSVVQPTITADAIQALVVFIIIIIIIIIIIFEGGGVHIHLSQV